MKTTHEERKHYSDVMKFGGEVDENFNEEKFLVKCIEDIDELEAKCKRYEKALTGISSFTYVGRSIIHLKDVAQLYQKIAKEALGENE